MAPRLLGRVQGLPESQDSRDRKEGCHGIGQELGGVDDSFGEGDRDEGGNEAGETIARDAERDEEGEDRRSQ